MDAEHVDFVDLGTVSDSRNWQLAHVEYRCRDHNAVSCSQPDRCYCGEPLVPCVPIGLVFVSEQDLMDMYQARTDENRARRT